MDTYTIHEISERFQLPASTLRYYEEIGLLENVGRTESHQRVYTEEHIRRLMGISCFKNTGLPIAKIQEFYLYERDMEKNIDKIVALLIKHEADTQAQIDKIQSDLMHIQEKVDLYQNLRDSFAAKKAKNTSTSETS